MAETSWPKLEGVETLFDMFERSARQFADCKCLGWRPVVDGQPGAYEWMTYKEAHGDQPKFPPCCLSSDSDVPIMPW